MVACQFYWVKIVVPSLIVDQLAVALRELADKVDATSDCDHKRSSCAEVGCIGVQVKQAREITMRQ